MVPEDVDDAEVRGGQPVTDRLLGRVVSFNDKHGYGFVETPDGGQWFFHASQLEDGDREDLVGRKVMFTEGHGPKGKIALKVKVGK